MNRVLRSSRWLLAVVLWGVALSMHADAGRKMFGVWGVAVTVDDMTDEKSVLAATLSTDARGMFGIEKVSLVLVCVLKNPVIYVNWERPMGSVEEAMSLGEGKIGVKHRFDKHKAVSQVWRMMDDQQTTMAYERDVTNEMVAGMRAYNNFRVQAQETFGGAKTANFDLNGFSDALVHFNQVSECAL